VTESHAAVEEFVRNACLAGDFQAAATRTFEAHGPEILSFLHGHLRSTTVAYDVFSMFAEDLWRGLPSFAFRSSLRAWLYTLARNAATRNGLAAHNRRGRHQALTGEPFLEGLVARARTATELHMQSEVKSKVRALRDRLTPEDQTLLILHVDRGLAWRELAQVLHDGPDQLEGDAPTREAARVRKRFERLKTQLRELARSEGIGVDREGSRDE
jgi:RNA polymerase sigma-70 factor (ECF subfamily)